MRKARLPESLILILSMVVIAQIATLILPAGEFQRDGRSVLPGTYQRIEEGDAESSTSGWRDTTAGQIVWVLPAALLALPRGLEAGADIIFFVFLVGGVIAVVRKTGAIDAMLGGAIDRFGGRPVLLVAGMTTIFSLGSSTIGMAEEYMPFVPILVTMCLGLRMDAVVALGIVYIGAGVGYGCAALNPFTVLIGQDIAGLTPASGQWFRWILLAVCLVVGVHHIMRYASRIKADPSRSLVSDIDYSEGFHMPENIQFSGRHALVIAAFVIALAAFVWGTKVQGWYLTELAALFLAIAISAAVFGRLSPNVASREFCRGAAEMTTTALLIGFARTIEVVLTDGKVIDTVIHGIAQPLEQVGSSGAAIGMLLVQSICNFFIPSGSGQAYVTMPIMAPLADLTGVTRQTSVLAYQMGDGFMNMIVPTNALLMGMLGLAKIPYERWVPFIGTLLLKLMVVAVFALVLAVAIDYA